jgi:RNA polymerase sigma-70 factor (ECF subfamily)
MAKFQTTQWSQVLAAGQGGETHGRSALESLCEAYWYPLYAYVRRQGNDPDAARDLTQAFFGHLLESDMLAVADPGRGRFRSFLLTSMKNFLSHERDKEAALKRGGGAVTISLDPQDAESRYDLEPVGDSPPDVLFERRWALTLMERAMSVLEAESKAGGSPERFEYLKRYLTGSPDQVPYSEAAEALGISEGTFRVAVHRIRQRYGELLRDEITNTVATDTEVDEELKHLLTVVSGGS